jgi:hypothetical protein
MNTSLLAVHAESGQFEAAGTSQTEKNCEDETHSCKALAVIARLAKATLL